MNFLQVALRALQLVFVAVCLGLSADLVATRGIYSHTPSLTSYVVFVAAWGGITFILGFVAAFVSALDGIIMAIFDGLAVLFFLAAGIAVAAIVKASSCSAPWQKVNNYSWAVAPRLAGVDMIRDGHCLNDGYNWYCDQSGDSLISRCRMAQALCAFLWFAWATFVGSLVADFMGGGGFRGRGRTSHV